MYMFMLLDLFSISLPFFQYVCFEFRGILSFGNPKPVLSVELLNSYNPALARFATGGKLTTSVLYLQSHLVNYIHVIA